MAPRISSSAQVRSVIVVDPAFDAYGDLAAAARDGRIDLHFRSAGTAALRLADRVDADAWIVAPDLEDMSGADFVELLRARTGTAAPAWVVTPVGVGPCSAGDVPKLVAPVTCEEITALLDAAAGAPIGNARLPDRFLALQAAGIGLATSLIIIALQGG
jgi:N-acyl-D-aspartate/D-glutamate deacylase